MLLQSSGWNWFLDLPMLIQILLIVLSIVIVVLAALIIYYVIKFIYNISLKILKKVEEKASDIVLGDVKEKVKDIAHKTRETAKAMAKDIRTKVKSYVKEKKETIKTLTSSKQEIRKVPKISLPAEINCTGCGTLLMNSTKEQLSSTGNAHCPLCGESIEIDKIST